MPRYEFVCQPCDAHFDVELPMEKSSDPTPCPFCCGRAARVITAPKLLFKADPLDNRPVWHNHGTYGHSHPRGRGFHGSADKPKNQE